MLEALLVQSFLNPALRVLLTQLLHDWHAGDPADLDAVLRGAAAAAAPAFRELAASPTVAIVQVPIDVASFDCFRSLFAYLLLHRQMVCVALYRRTPLAAAAARHGKHADASFSPFGKFGSSGGAGGGGGEGDGDGAAPAYIYTNPDLATPLRAGDEAVVLLRL